MSATLSEVRATDVRIRTVTVFEDRAHVVRQGTIELSPGLYRIRVPDIAPIVVDKTLLVTQKSGPACTFSSHRVERSARVLERDKPIDTQELDRDITRAQEDLTRVERLLDRTQRDARSLRDLGARYLTEVSVDTSWERAPSAGPALGKLLSTEVETARRVAQHESERARLKERLERLVAEKRAADRVEHWLGADVVIDLKVAAAGSVELSVEYTVPNAVWRPWHTATLTGDGPEASVELTSDATIWQNTGEDWRGVNMVFSTERPSRPKDPPRLEDDLLFAQRKGPAVVVETRETEIEKPGEGAGGGSAATPQAPGLDDGGEVRRLASAHPVDVPSDGRPYRIRLQRFVAKAECTRVLVAEMVPAVIVRASAIHGGAAPILAGPVDLIKNGGPVGRTKLLFTAPGERFSLGFGPDADVVVHRDVTQLVTETKVLSSWTTTPYKVTLRISNLVDAAKAIEVSERVPVSEVEKVTIAVDPKKTTEAKTPDRDGFLKWDVRLGAREHRTVELVYALARHGDVVGV